MKLRDAVLELINDSKIRNKLAIALDCTEFTILRYIKNNDDNLTKAAAIKVIQKETGLKPSQILMEEQESSFTK